MGTITRKGELKHLRGLESVEVAGEMAVRSMPSYAPLASPLLAKQFSISLIYMAYINIPTIRTYGHVPRFLHGSRLW